jgi:hypothetical protein
MSKRVKNRAKRASLEVTMRATWERWTHSHTRGRRPVEDLRVLIAELLTAAGTGIVTREQVIDEHRARRTLRLDVAIAEVDQYRDRVVDWLREKGGYPMLHPITEYGARHANRVSLGDPATARCVPGLGDGGPLFGWRIPTRSADPVYMAYTNHLGKSGIGAVNGAQTRVAAGIAAGLLKSGAAAPVALPPSILDEGAA